VVLASAATVAIGAAASNSITVTGTTTITAFDTVAAGIVRRVKFTGVLLLTYNVTSLILPTAANITTQAGDEAVFRSLGTGNWECIGYTRADGTSLAISPAILATDIHALTGKTTPAAADELPLLDSASGFALVKLTFGNLLTTLYGYVVQITATTGSAIIPAGTTAQRDATPAVGYSRFNTTLSRFEYWNGTSWIASLDTTIGDGRYSSGAFPFAPVAASNALGGSLGACILSFRNPTLTTGTPVQASIASSLALPAIPATSSLGAVSAQQTRLAYGVAYNGGTPVAVVANADGGIDINESNLFSPTTIGAASNSASTIYSASAVAANSPIKWIGIVDATWTSGTGWVINAVTPLTGQVILPSLILSSLILAGGNWIDQTASRAFGTTYTNTGKTPRQYSIYGINVVTPGGMTLTATVTSPSGVATTHANGAPGAGLASNNAYIGLFVEIPPKYTISVVGIALTLDKWNERQL